MKLNDIVLSNKYTKWYFSICTNAKSRARTRSEAKTILGIVEGHHILPKSIEPNSEIVYVSVKEHFVLHHLLTKMLTGQHKHKMIYALNQFLQGRSLTPQQIAICLSHKHQPCTESRRNNISQSRQNTSKVMCIHCSTLVDPGNYTKYHGDNCKSNPNVDMTIWRTYQAKSRAGMKMQRESNTFHKPTPLIGSFTCPHCDKTGTNFGSMKRHHFDNCPKLTGKKSFKLPVARCSCINCKKETDIANISRHRCKN